MNTVFLVLETRCAVRCTPEAAMEICRDPVLSGFVIDALTSDRELRHRLRELMDGHADSYAARREVTPAGAAKVP